MDNENRAQKDCRSELKVLVGKKKGIMEVEETSENSSKRVKMRALDSVFLSESKITHPLKEGNNADSKAFDLNVNVGSVNGKLPGDTPAFIKESNNIKQSKGLDLNLNAEEISSSMNVDPFHPYKNSEHVKSRDESECASSVGPLDEKDSLRVWKGLKQNNFMSTSYVAAPIPKPRGRKKNNDDIMKKKIELAKREQVDRFARVAAPSGLLNGLNPGIINHVRNSKQVHSIIEALVKSERAENRMQELNGGENSSRSHRGFLLGRREMSDFGLFSESTGVVRRDGDSYMNFARMASSLCNFESENDGLALKLSSTSENASCLSNDESANLGSVSSLSFKGANVASQWLELLSQDIRGRLSALRRSKKRVRAVITTELPFLISKEFSHTVDKTTVDAHTVRWNTMFGQMDKALSEEENHLENWLNQVKEMQVHCERGLCTSSSTQPSHQIGSVGNDTRSGEVDNPEKDLAVRAAAASIYSTCNFLLSKENLPCRQSL